MTHSLLNDVLLIKDKPIDIWKAYFETIGITIFDCFFVEGKYSESEIKHRILYVLYAFSEDSPKVISRISASEEKRAICNFLKIPESLHDEYIGLKDDSLRLAVTSYLYAFAGELFRNYMFSKIQLIDVDYMITNRTFRLPDEVDEDGKPITYTFDSKEYMKVVAHREKLARDVYRIESDMKQQIQLIGLESVNEKIESSSTSKFKGGRSNKRGAIENIIGK